MSVVSVELPHGITHVLQKYEQILIQSIEHLTVEVQGSSEEKGLVKQDT